MYYQFGVIRTLTRDARLFICGSIAELGNWDPKSAVQMDTTNFVLNEPSFWTVRIEIETGGPFEFKFITKYGDEEKIEWEGMDSTNNRSSCDGEENENDGEMKNCQLLTPTWWKANEKSGNEFQNTTAFYYNTIVRDGYGIHFNQIFDQVFLGSCPRQPHHITTLKNLGIDTIMNLQTEYDMVNNCADVIDGSGLYQHEIIDRLENIYHRNAMCFVWLPTGDMSTPARRRILPEAVALLKLLLDNGRTVYVHCNAGIGRAASIVAGYLIYVKGMTLTQTMYFLYEKRPAVYFDRAALMEAEKDFRSKYCTRVRRGVMRILTRI